MTTVVKSASSTVIALLGAVNSLATGVAQTIDNVGRGSSMLDAYVQKAQKEQSVSYTVQAVCHADNVVDDLAMEQMLRQVARESKLGFQVTDQRKQELFTQNRDRLAASLTTVTP